MSTSLVLTVASELVARRGQHAVKQARSMSRALQRAGDAKAAAVWAQLADAAEAMVQVRAQ